MKCPVSATVAEAVAQGQQNGRHKVSEERSLTHAHHGSNMHGWNEVGESHVHAR